MSPQLWGPWVAVAVVVLVVLGAASVLRRRPRRRGPKSRGRVAAVRTIDLRDPVPPPRAVLAPVPGHYLATTRAGQPSQPGSERVLVHGLGVPGRATLLVTDDGLQWQRQGADVLTVPRSALRDCRIEQPAVVDGGDVADPPSTTPVLVVVWIAGSSGVETRFRPQEPQRHDEVRAAVLALIDAAAAPGDPAAFGPAQATP